jgi:hypothetical protein
MNPVTFFNINSNDILRTLVNAYVDRVLADGGTVNDLPQLLVDLRTTRYRNKIKLGYFPNGQKESKVYSIFPNTANGDFTFTRTGNAWRVGSNGFWSQNSANVPGIDYRYGVNCLLFERFRNNRIIHSQAFQNAAWVKTGVTVTDNNQVSPSNATNATLLQGIGTLRQTGNFQNTSNQFDIFVKRISGSGNLIIKCGVAEKTISPTTEWQRYEVITRSITATYTATSGVFTVVCAEAHKLNNNDWIRTSSLTGGETARNIQVTVVNATTFTYTVGSFTGSGGLNVLGNFVEIENLTTSEFAIWQAQNTTSTAFAADLNGGFIEFSTSIIPTTASQSSKNGDIFQIDNLHTNINTANEGVIFLEFFKNSTTNGNFDGELIDIVNSDNVSFSALISLPVPIAKQNNLGVQRSVGGIARLGISVGSVNGLNRIALKYNATTLQGFVNGIQLNSIALTSVNTLVKKLEIVNGMALRKLIMYETLTNQECIDITS